MTNQLSQTPGKDFKGDIQLLCKDYAQYNSFDAELNNKYNVKRGLRNADGTGVLAGLTQICNVHGYMMSEGEKVAIDGELIYRGININDLIAGCQAENRFCFEETAWLLMMGYLPNQERLSWFREFLAQYRNLPENFTEDVIMKVASPDIMNMLAKCVLALYTYDPMADNTSVENVLYQSMALLARMPSIMVAAYQVKRRVYDGKSMYLHNPKPELSTAENILRMMRADKSFTDEEARLLDLCLMLHSDHGGGNNSTFAVRVLTSTGTDTYSAISAGIGSLKGPRHGGASGKVIQQLEFLKSGVKNWDSDSEIKDYLRKCVKGQAGDGSGLIYGIGHAVYTKSDPRANLLKKQAFQLAKGSQFEAEFQLLDAVERLGREVLCEKWGTERTISNNIDLYSGLVYRMLGIPDELHTPLFAIARTSGWSAHRLEEMTTNNKIMRPAYKAIAKPQGYTPLMDRT